MRNRIFFPILVLTLLLGGAQMALAQGIDVKGCVQDATGEPLVGASIKLRVSADSVRQIAMTDIDGNFTARQVPERSRLIVSYIGMGTREVTATRSPMTIVLEDKSEQMEEVMVVAFGKQKRSSFTGSASVVGEDAISRKQVTNAISAIQGEVAGVQMTNNSGDPTAEPEIRIRGFSSINAGNDPLIILDGAPYDGGFNSINPADVASLTVLKDAASNALYGARGANGVILITTKSAQRGEAKTSITFDSKWGSNKEATIDYNYVRNPGAYYELYYQALHNAYLKDGKATTTHTSMPTRIWAPVPRWAVWATWPTACPMARC